MTWLLQVLTGVTRGFAAEASEARERARIEDFMVCRWTDRMRKSP